ncbi:phosphate acetyltransferase [Miniphocaeibacter halophilus]|uniref:Phosphate acetyltransferase n=1 Tax=Miniphocaeibacter halophilus TaxID=2931922 RepID=A0AC61MT83_9FIRM|nr:phosphate acetyltransferase [Miniphocaeibacter halophilus]QQK08766.1 phosphate acetyltransferase [Miniphocaeibacter halophilus]
MNIIESIKEKVAGKNMKIVFPEGEDKRVLGAAIKLKNEGLIEPIMLGDIEEIKKTAKENSFDISKLQIIEIEKYDEFDALVDAFVERRKGKATREQAVEMLKTVNYFGTMLVYTGKADGLVSGAVFSTGDTVRPALQIIKTRPGVSRTSGAMLMLGQNGEKYMFADIAINITLEPQELAEVAVETAKTARIFDIDPKVAMLSFSTMGSAKHELAERVAEATKIAKELAPDLALDGEMQFDAAVAPEVGAKKAPNSPVAGKANVFVFPDLQAGNIGYKIAQRLGGYEAIGPILQGLNMPISDLSRGSNEEDIYKLSLITAAQALEK